MGGPPRKSTDANGDAGQGLRQKPEEVVEDIDFRGLSLEEFAAEDSIERRPPLPVHSAQSIEECMSSFSILLPYAHCACR